MRYYGNFSENFRNASGDSEMQADLVIDEIAFLIEKYPELVISALNDAGVETSSNISTKALINRTVNAMSNNAQMRGNMSDLVTASAVGAISKMKKAGVFDNASGGGDLWGQIKGFFGKTGGGAAGGAAGGGTAGAIAGAVGGLIDSIFTFSAAKKDAEAAKEESKAKIYEKIFGEQKTNWIPIVVIGGVLIIGGVVTYFALKK